MDSLRRTGDKGPPRLRRQPLQPVLRRPNRLVDTRHLFLQQTVSGLAFNRLQPLVVGRLECLERAHQLMHRRPRLG